MLQKIDEWIQSHENEIIFTLCELIRIKSVQDGPEQGAPFGVNVKRALTFMLKTAESYGLATRDMDGYIGYADAGYGDKTLGIMCHLDVVPEGAGWEHAAFSAEIENGLIFGRGAMDDKGPAVCALFALAAVVACGVPFRRRVRLLFGCNEEGGWDCINHYASLERMPDLAFSPDCSYPLVHSEKGILCASYKKPFASKLRISAGTRPNVVPGLATAFVPLAPDRINAEDCPLPCEVIAEKGGSTITVTGLAAHASKPEDGKNAILALFKLLSALPLDGEDASTVGALCAALSMDMHGEGMGLDYEDASGRLTVNPAVLAWNESGIERFDFDLRCPMTKSCGEVRERLNAALAGTGLTLFENHIQAAHYVDPDSELVKTLLGVYAARTGEYLPPIATGGGTYARAIKNAVAFGCERPGVDNRIHMPDEFISIDDLMFNTRMLCDAIIALSCDVRR